MPKQHEDDHRCAGRKSVKIRKDVAGVLYQLSGGQEIFSQYGSVKEVTVLPVAAGKNAAAAFVIMHTVSKLQSQKKN